MDLSLLLMADYASTSSDGKLYIMGVFNAIRAVTFPIQHPELYLVIQFTASAFEYGRQSELQVVLHDEDGGTLLNMSAPIQVPTGENGRDATINALLKLTTLPFAQPGRYEFGVQVDRDLKGRLAFDVIQINPS